MLIILIKKMLAKPQIKSKNETKYTWYLIIMRDLLTVKIIIFFVDANIQDVKMSFTDKPKTGVKAANK